MLYQITIPYNIQAERRGETEDIEAYEAWFESAAEINKGDQIEWGDRLLYVSNRRPKINRGSAVTNWSRRRPKPSKEAVTYIKLFCMNV